jgi:hypothetical protein
LLLADGRVLVFRLGHTVNPDDDLATALAGNLAPDVRGDVLEIDLREGYWLGVLYGAPASPIFCVDPVGSAFAKALLFHSYLDGEILAFLASLAGKTSFWASARNYSRLAIHARRHERLQALRRYPLLLPPVLLSHQRWPNLSDVKRFRWRAHDDAVVAAVDHGQDLSGVLAAYYGISRGLVGSPFCARAWAGSGGRSLGDFLQFIDAIPAHRRPKSGAEIDVYAQHLPALWGLFGSFARNAAVAFREGFAVVWQRLQRRFDSPAMPLNVVIIDAGDYLRALVAWLRATYGRRFATGEIAALWVKQRGLASLLAASLRWHAQIARSKPGGRIPLPESVPVVIGKWSDGEWQARELFEYQAMEDEGAQMHHCIADYWDDCVFKGYRVFSLTRQAEKATAMFELALASREPVYNLAQIRGVANVLVDAPMQLFAERLGEILNAPERASARQSALDFVQQVQHEEERPTSARLDAQSMAVLNVLLDLSETGPQSRVDRESLPVAGYAHAFDAQREAKFALGQALALVREPDNPFDPLAVRIDWEGQKIGYVPRAQNAVLVAQLDQGQVLTAHISRLERQAPMWERLWFKMEVC